MSNIIKKRFKQSQKRLGRHKLTSFLNARILRPFGLALRPVTRNTLDEDGLFSLLGEEAILRDLIAELGEQSRFYVDIGASDGISMSNTARLAVNGWKGVCFEYNTKKVASLATNYEDFGAISICRALVTPANICAFLQAYDVPHDFGVLSIDIDSYDFFVLESILSSYEPSIIIAEINEKIPPPVEFTVLYDPYHEWDGSHFYGQSISQIEKLCGPKNYMIVALEYNNVFMVPAHKYSKRGLSAREAYESGYSNRPDRKEKFPWNENMEELLSMSPLEAVSFLNTFFVKYKGKYYLSPGSSSDIPPYGVVAGNPAKIVNELPKD